MPDIHCVAFFPLLAKRENINVCTSITGILKARKWKYRITNGLHCSLHFLMTFENIQCIIMHFRLSSLKCNSLKSGSGLPICYNLGQFPKGLNYIFLWVNWKLEPLITKLIPLEKRSLLTFWLRCQRRRRPESHRRENQEEEAEDDGEEGEAVASDFYEARGVTVAVDGEESCSLVKPWSTRKLSRLRW